MTIKEIYSEIINHCIEGIMLHQQATKMMDFLGFRGLKRWQEYQYFKESAELSSLNRYIINHHNVMVSDGEPKDPKIIPVSWYNYNRYELDNSTKKSALKEFFGRWKTWEEQTKDLYCKMYKEACTESNIADANKIKCLIEDVDHELKCVERKYLEYKSVDFSLDYIMYEQCYIHDKYKEKSKKIGIDIN